MTTEQITSILYLLAPFILFLILFMIFKAIINKYSKCYRKKQNEKKGAQYEKNVAQYYISKNYEVEERGLKKGLKDGGIDLIASKQNQILLIQCKNWNPDNSFKIKETMVREFYGACHFYINDKEIKDKEIICVYVIPNKSLLTIGALNLFKKHYLKCRYQIV